MLNSEDEQIDKLEQLGVQLLPCKLSCNGFGEIDTMMKR